MSNKNTPFQQSGAPKARDTQPGQTVQLDFSLATDIKCENVIDPISGELCNNYTFVPVILFKHFSAIASPNGQEGMAPINSYACNACGWVNARFLPKGFFGSTVEVVKPSDVSKSSLVLEK